jgi:Histidine kinase-like ATPase domain
MLGGVAELLQLDPELLDDVKTAVSEACNNVVMHAYEGASGPLCICISAEEDGLVVTVRDQGRGIPPLAPSIMRALALQTAFQPAEDGGTEVWLKFAAERDGRPLYKVPDNASPDDGWSDQLEGDAIVSLSPVTFVGGVLGRLARAMAARARFSLDRFSDVYLVTDAVAAHAARAASAARLSFGLSTNTRRLEMAIGPLRPGASSELTGGAPDDVGSALRLLSDEIDVRRDNGAEILHIVMLDERARATA